jgi:general secretion pathway protein G
MLVRVKLFCRVVRTLPLLLILAACTISCKPREDPHFPRPRVQIAAFETGLGMFREDCGRYPTTTEGLAALITRPTGIPEGRWHGPYFDHIPKDPWGHDYVYRCPGIHNTNRFDLYSCGPDGVTKSGGVDEDDIANWRSRRSDQ